MVSTPSPPDPYEQADAQAGANIDSAIATDLLNNRTEITPTGKVEYVDSGMRTIVDSQGNTRQIPTRDRIITLSDDQQQLLDLTEETSKNLLGTAVERSDFLKGYLQDGLDTSTLTPWAGPVDAPTLDTSALNFTQLQGYGGPDGSLQYDYEANTVSQPGALERVSAPASLQQVDAPADLISYVPQSGVDLNSDYSGVSSGLKLSGGSRASGSIAGVGEGIQNSVDLDKTGGDIRGIRQSYSTQAIDGGIADAGPIQSAVNYGGPGIRYGTTMEQYATPLEDAGDIRRTLGVNDYAAQRNDVEDAVMSRYNRHFADMESNLDAKLRAQGLAPGSEAYDTQFRQLREQQNDAVMQAVLAGGQEQSRLFGLDQASAEYERAAQGQEFDQALQKGLYGLNVNNQNNQTALAADQFYNNSVGQGFDQALKEGTFFNAAQGQQFGQNREQTLTTMDATERNNARQEDLARFSNEGQNQRFQQTLANAGFANDAELAMGNFANAAQAQGFDQAATQTQMGIAAAGVNNQAAQIQNQAAIAAAQLELQAQQAANNTLLAEAGFNNDALMSSANFFNDATTQGLQNSLAATGFNNATTTQGLQNDLAATGFNNATTTQALQNELAATGFNNTTNAGLAAFNNATYGQDLAGGLSLAGYNSGIDQQNNQNLAAVQAARNAALGQQYALDQSAVDNQNALRQNELQEAAYLRGLPLSEINSLMSGSELLMPQFTPPLQTGVAPVPIGQYMQQSYENELANSSAKANGLFGFASNVLGALPIFG